MKTTLKANVRTAALTSQWTQSGIDRFNDGFNSCRSGPAGFLKCAYMTAVAAADLKLKEKQKQSYLIAPSFRLY